MNWFIRTLAGAVIGGLGWKLGADAYEVIKKRIQQKQDGSAEEKADDVEEGAASAAVVTPADGDGEGGRARPGVRG